MFTFESENDKKIFMNVLEKANKGYDAKVKMHKRAFSSPGYHTTLTGGDVHSTRDSLVYAVALFDSGIPEYIERGKEIALKVVSLQDIDEENITYGIWSWFYEEPLSQMSPPDWNWADFCGKELLQILMDHNEYLSTEEYETIKSSVYHACKSIMRRDVRPGYTNISFMGTYVTVIAGEGLGQGFEEILDYGKKRLAKIHAYNMKKNNFDEYNSPTYTLLASEDLTKFYSDIQDETCKSLIYDLLRICWRTIITHIHYSSRQWAGPHRRDYSEFLKPETRVKLQRAFRNKLNFIDEEEAVNYYSMNTFRFNLICPDEFFNEYYRVNAANNPVTIFERFSGCREDGQERAEIATAYLSDSFSLGSFYKDIMWNQRKNVVAYFGNQQFPFCFRVKCLHDFYDYSSAFICTTQHEGSIASIISFGTNGGDTHPSLDMVKDGKIATSDFRIRFIISGNTDKLEECGWINEESFAFSLGELFGLAHIPFARFGNHKISTDISKYEHNLNLDLILYHGEETEIDFNNLLAGIGFSLEIKNDNDFSKSTTLYSLEEDLLTIEFNRGKNLKTVSSIKSDVFDKLYQASYGEINSICINDLV